MWWSYKAYKDGKWQFNGALYGNSEDDIIKKLREEYKDEYTYKVQRIL